MISFLMPCPAYDEEKDDVCGEELEIEAYKAEPATWTYPGAPAEFEVIGCKCKHKELVEKGKYADDVWEFIRDAEIARLEARYDDEKERNWFLMARW